MVTEYLGRPPAPLHRLRFGSTAFVLHSYASFQGTTSPSRLASKPQHSPSFRPLLGRRIFYQPKARLHTRTGSTRLKEQLSKVINTVREISQSDTPPQEESSQAALRRCERLAETLAGVEVDDKAESPTSSLLDLEELHRRSNSPTPKLTPPMRDRIADQVSEAAYDIITNPKVFITPLLIATYVDTQALLNRPETIPSVFSLYASKPVPRPNTSPIEYTPSRPTRAASAVPISTASRALDAAIDAKNLSICLDIINTTVCAPAFRRSKLVRRAIFPALGVAIAPAAAYSAATQWAMWQDTMDSQLARNIMFAGLLAYISCTATIGVVAITTSNDQMSRVTWASGIPLRDRWLREEERAMLDRVASAWGFHESWKRGEEEGPDWQRLRERAGLRGMVLDKVELMEGME